MKPTVHRYWKYGAIVLACGLVGRSIKDWHLKNTLREIYQYDVDVTVVDDVTGKPLDDVTMDSPSVSTDDIIEQAFRISRGPDGIISMSGIGYEPREWRFGREGYKSASLIVDDDTPSSIVIKMKPKEAEPGAAGKPPGSPLPADDSP